MDERVAPDERRAEEVDAGLAEGHGGPRLSTTTTSTGTPWRVERRDVVRDGVASGLGQLGAEVADVDALGARGAHRLDHPGHRGRGEHAREERPRADRDLVRGEQRLDDGVGARPRRGRRARRARCSRRHPTATCPVTAPLRPVERSTTRAVVAGSTRPRAPSSRPASSTAASRSPSVPIEPGEDEVAERVPGELALGEASLEGHRERGVLRGDAPRGTCGGRRAPRRRAARAADPRSRRRRPPRRRR